MYNELLKLWREENENDALSIVPRDFKTQILSYLEKLTKIKESYQDASVEQDMMKQEIHEFTRLLNDFLKVRLNKIICLTIEGVNLEKTHLTSEEQKVIESFKSSILSFFSSFQLKSENEVESTEMTETTSKLMVIRILEDIDEEIVGVDLKNYGPFKKEDIVTIPEKNAYLLIEKKAAMPVKMQLT